MYMCICVYGAPPPQNLQYGKHKNVNVNSCDIHVSCKRPCLKYAKYVHEVYIKPEFIR